MKMIVAALALSIASAAGFAGISNRDERELTTVVATRAEAASLAHHLSEAARALGHKHVRVYGQDVFVPLEQATLSFIREGDQFVMHVAVESEYRFAKADRAAALAALKAQGDAVLAKALELRAAR
jgi:hypothetical protein